MNISLLSNKYNVKRIETPDIEIVYELCCNNSLYYQYCPPFVSTQSIMDDMSASPPNKKYANISLNDNACSHFLLYGRKS